MRMIGITPISTIASAFSRYSKKMNTAPCPLTNAAGKYSFSAAETET